MSNNNSAGNITKSLQLTNDSQQPAPDSLVGFMCLPGELRTRIYELVLLDEEDVSPLGVFRKELSPGFLCANKTIHSEATWTLQQESILFLQCQFQKGCHLPPQNRQQKMQVTFGISPLNFQGFPKSGMSTSGSTAPTRSKSSTVAAPTLSTITITRDSTDNMEIMLCNLHNPQCATEVLNLVDSRLRAFLSLQEVILQVYEDAPSDQIMSKRTDGQLRLNIVSARQILYCVDGDEL